MSVPRDLILIFEEGLFKWNGHLYAPYRVAYPRICCWCDCRINRGSVAYRALCKPQSEIRICAVCFTDLTTPIL